MEREEGTHALLRNTDLGGGFQNVARRRAENRDELLTADPSTTERMALARSCSPAASR